MDISPVGRYKDFFLNFTLNEKRIYYNKIKEMIVSNQISLRFSFDHLMEFDKDLASNLLDKPLENLEYISQAIKEIVTEQDPEYASKVYKFYGRVYGLGEEIPIRNIRGRHIDKLIQIKGIVTKCSKIYQKLIEASFQCMSCNNIFSINFKETFFRSLFQVKCDKCESNLIKILDKKLLDVQRIVVQELTEEIPAGQIPRTLEVYLEDDLVDTAYPGNRVTIVGILKERRERDVTSELTFRMYLHAVDVEVKEKGYEEEILTKEDEEIILQLASSPNITEKIVKSIAPSIFGLENIKTALALQLFGGVPKVLPDGIKIRGDINILLVGDPGTAKTQLLRYIARIAPKGIYTSGKGVSAAGLTASVVRDKITGEFYLEAGALVLADQGICAVDEIDKMRSEDRVAMHEAMEQQTISIAKAGIVATLNARCSLLAAANPSLGRFDKTKTLVDNINLPITLLSRFDLIFPIIDVPSKDYDMNLSSHIVELHSERGFKYKEDIIPPDLLKKYVIYARKYVHPKLNEEAKNEIINFYLKMREASYKEPSSIAITPRQLESLIRLTEARARMRLSNECNAEDALVAINLMKSMMYESFFDVQTQKIDVDIVMTGIPSSRRDIHSKIMDILTKLNYHKEEVEKEHVLNVAESEGIPRHEAEKIIRMLIRDGLIYEPKPGYIKRTP